MQSCFLNTKENKEPTKTIYFEIGWKIPWDVRQQTCNHFFYYSYSIQSDPYLI